MHIAEIFRSLQGEGRLTGVESVFIRVSGCNLRCRYCDTAYASWSANGNEMSVREILDTVDCCIAEETPKHIKSLASSPVYADLGPHVVITGGEPMLFDETVLLSQALRRAGWHITIETNGTVYRPVVCDLLSISPKLSNSSPPMQGPHWRIKHESSRHAPGVVERLIVEHDCQFKFVIDAPEDCAEVERYLADVPRIDPRRVFLMPQGVHPGVLAEKAEWLEPYCRRHGLMFCPRKQIEWFGPGRGK